MRIERRRGDTRPDVCYVTLSSTGDPANITGCTFKMVVSTSQFPADSSTVLYTVDGVIGNAANGEVQFAPTALQADRAGYFYYEVKMTDTYGAIHTPVWGSYDYK